MYYQTMTSCCIQSHSFLKLSIIRNIGCVTQLRKWLLGSLRRRWKMNLSKMEWGLEGGLTCLRIVYGAGLVIKLI
jgi:hypothetical protein